MDDTQDTNLNAQGAKPPDVKPKHAGGPKPKGYYERTVQTILDGSAPAAAILLDEHMNQVKGHTRIKDSVLKICFFVIDHAIGKARQKVEHSGGILTYSAIAKSAEKLETKPRPILAEVEELANKHEPEPVSDDKNHEPETPKPEPDRA